MSDNRLSDKHAELLGQRFATMFHLVPDKDGFYSTVWGNKTLVGLGRTVDKNYEFAMAEIERDLRDERNGKL